MNNTVSPSQNAANVFEQQGFTPRQVEQMVILKAPVFEANGKTFNSVMPGLMAKYGETSWTLSGNYKYSLPRRGISYPITQTNGTPTYSNSDLTVTFNVSDPTYSNIGVGSLVKDLTTNTNATVIAVSAGLITAQYDSNSSGSQTAFDTSDDFANGHNIQYLGIVNDNVNRQVPNGQTTLPNLDQYIIGKWDEKATIKSIDAKRKTYFNSDLGTPYYAMQVEVEALNRLYTAYYLYMYGDNVQVDNASKPRSMSFINQLKTFGSECIVPKNGAISLADFEDLIIQYKRKGGNTSDSVYLCGGMSYNANISRILRDKYVQYPGKENVVGGADVIGLDVPFYQVCGMKVMPVIDMFLEHPAWGGTRSDTAFWIDAAPVPTGQGKMMSPIMDVYNEWEGLHQWDVPGGVDRNGNPIARGTNGQLACDVNFDLQQTKIITNVEGALYHGN